MSSIFFPRCRGCSQAVPVPDVQAPSTSTSMTAPAWGDIEGEVPSRRVIPIFPGVVGMMGVLRQQVVDNRHHLKVRASRIGLVGFLDRQGWQMTNNIYGEDIGRKPELYRGFRCRSSSSGPVASPRRRLLDTAIENTIRHPEFRASLAQSSVKSWREASPSRKVR